MTHDLLALTRLNIRTRRGYLLAWCLPLWALVAAFPPAYESYYPTLESRQPMIEGLRSNTGTTAIYGVIADPGTIGQMTAWEIGAWVGLLGSVMAVLLVTGLHRRAEYSGLGELQRSTGIRPVVPAAAALITTLLAAVVLGAGSSVVLLFEQAIVEELTTSGAFAFGASVALAATGSALLAQAVLLFIHDGAALTRAALLTVLASFIIRVVADTRELTWLNWFSPLGWREVIGPYDTDDWTVVAVLVGVCLLAAVLIGAADRRRSFATGLLPRRRQASRRPRHIRGPLGLRWVLSRGVLVAWVLVVAGLSGFLMSLSGTIADLVGTSEGTGEVFRDLFDGDAVYEEFIAYICQVIGILIAAAGVQQITAHHAEEQARTVDLQRSTGVRRWVPLGATTLVALLSLVAMTVALLAGGAVGLASQENTMDEDYASLTYAALSQLGPTLFLTGIAVLLVGAVPRLTQFAWAPLAAGAVVSLMGAILQLPDWAIDASPFSHTQLPGDDSLGVPLGLAVGGLVLMGVGLVAAHRREIL
ncbi:hypothetical protein [Corynebacterium halotolerans]|uniref:ABC transporter permease n=1 Tax=Corynebacterium halotolerans YIM 70093 = DSM 44683 TaxID=1121362 RepID=M1PAS6_9CORY|nr:hypothetical protein [Corynebacterium halotolerans]AGF73786.1 hypothetical protein A605_13950 [Corynebacterium halotolerans YIM 70093 = DSM 44683]